MFSSHPHPHSHVGRSGDRLIATSSKHFLVFRAKGRDGKVEEASGPGEGS